MSCSLSRGVFLGSWRFLLPGALRAAVQQRAAQGRSAAPGFHPIAERMQVGSAEVLVRAGLSDSWLLQPRGLWPWLPPSQHTMPFFALLSPYWKLDKKRSDCAAVGYLCYRLHAWNNNAIACNLCKTSLVSRAKTTAAAEHRMRCDMLSSRRSRRGADKCTVLKDGLCNSAVVGSPSSDCWRRFNHTANVAGIPGCSQAAQLDGFHAPLPQKAPVPRTHRSHPLGLAGMLCLQSACSAPAAVQLGYAGTLRHAPAGCGPLFSFLDLGTRGIWGEEPWSVWGAF